MNIASIEGEKAGGKGGRHGPCIGFARFLFFMPIAAAHARKGKGRPSVDSSMKTQKKTTRYEWLAERKQRQCEGLWLNDKNAVIGLSKLNPLPRDSAVNKSLKGCSLAGSAGFHGLNTGTPDGGGLGFLLKPAQPAKIVMQKPKAGG